MKPNGVVMATLEPAEETPPMEEGPGEGKNETTSLAKENQDSGKAKESKSKVKLLNKASPAAKSTGTRPGTANRAVNGVQKQPAAVNNTAKKPNPSIPDKKKATPPAPVRKTPAVMEKKPVRAVTAPAVSNGAKNTTSPSKKAPPGLSNSVKAKPAAPRPASAAPPKSNASPAAKTDKSSVSKATRPAGGSTAPHPAPGAATKPAARPSPARATTAPPSAGHSPVKPSTPMKKETGKPTPTASKNAAKPTPTKPSKNDSPKVASAPKQAATPKASSTPKTTPKSSSATKKPPAISKKPSESKTPQPKTPEAKVTTPRGVSASPRTPSSKSIVSKPAAGPKKTVGSCTPMPVKRTPKASPANEKPAKEAEDTKEVSNIADAAVVAAAIAAVSVATAPDTEPSEEMAATLTSTQEVEQVELPSQAVLDKPNWAGEFQVTVGDLGTTALSPPSSPVAPAAAPFEEMLPEVLLLNTPAAPQAPMKAEQLPEVTSSPELELELPPAATTQFVCDYVEKADEEINEDSNEDGEEKEANIVVKEEDVTVLNSFEEEKFVVREDIVEKPEVEADEQEMVSLLEGQCEVEEQIVLSKEIDVEKITVQSKQQIMMTEEVMEWEEEEEEVEKESNKEAKQVEEEIVKGIREEKEETEMVEVMEKVMNKQGEELQEEKVILQENVQVFEEEQIEKETEKLFFEEKDMEVESEERFDEHSINQTFEKENDKMKEERQIVEENIGTEEVKDEVEVEEFSEEENVEVVFQEVEEVGFVGDVIKGVVFQHQQLENQQVGEEMDKSVEEEEGQYEEEGETIVGWEEYAEEKQRFEEVVEEVLLGEERLRVVEEKDVKELFEKENLVLEEKEKEEFPVEAVDEIVVTQEENNEDMEDRLCQREHETVVVGRVFKEDIGGEMAAALKEEAESEDEMVVQEKDVEIGESVIEEREVIAQLDEEESEDEEKVIVQEREIEEEHEDEKEKEVEETEEELETMLTTLKVDHAPEMFKSDWDTMGSTFPVRENPHLCPDISASSFHEMVPEVATHFLLERSEDEDDLNDAGVNTMEEDKQCSVVNKPVIPSYQSDEEDDDKENDMEVGSEKAEDHLVELHEEEDEDEDIEMASEGVTEGALESYGNPDEDDLEEEVPQRDNLNSGLQPASVPTALWQQCPQVEQAPWPPGAAPCLGEAEDKDHSESETSTPGEPGDYDSSSGVESRSEGKQPMPVSPQARPDIEQDLGIHMEKGDGEEEEEEEAETLPADEVLGDLPTAPTSAPSSPCTSGDEGTEGEVPVTQSDPHGIDNMAFDCKPLAALEERVGEEEDGDGGSPQSAASAASYGFDCPTSTSNAHSTAESCGKSPGVFSLENEDQLAEEAKNPSLVQALTMPAATAFHEDLLGDPVHLLPVRQLSEEELEDDEEEEEAAHDPAVDPYLLCGKPGVDLSDTEQQDDGLRLPSQLPVHPSGDGPDGQPAYFSTVCDKTDSFLAGNV